MRASRARLAAGIAVAGILAAAGAATATDDRGQGRDDTARFRTVLTGYEEVAANIGAISTTGSGGFRAALSRDGKSVHWVLSYSRLEGAVQQAHIHFGQRHTTGGVSVFLCSNLPNPPAGTQACPQQGVVRGTFAAGDVLGPVGQGIEPGAFDELVHAMITGTTYANVHSAKWPAGEIRGQLDPRGRW